MPTALHPRRAILLAVVMATLWACVGEATADADAPSDRAEGKHIRVRLVADRASVTPGGTVRLGVVVTTDPNWHVYWKQPGDAGLAPKLTWGAPRGFRVGPQRWPLPTLHEVGPLVAYLYDREVLLPVEVQSPFVIEGNEATFTVRVDWLVCEDDQGCIPGDATLTLTLPVDRAAAASSKDAARFRATFAALPVPAPVGMRLDVDDDGARIRLPKEGPWAATGVTYQVFWEGWETFDPLSVPSASDGEDGRVLRIALAEGQKRPDGLDVLLVVSDDVGTRRGYKLSWRDAAASPTRAAAAPDADAPAVSKQDATPAAADDDLAWADAYVEYGQGGHGAGGAPVERSLLGAFLLAFLGGILLNIMPCVLPVVSLKILGFVDQAGSDPVRTRRHGYAFGAGVLASFLAIAGLLLLLRGDGADVGWGFQLQEPAVVTGLAVLMFLVGLNLLGVFEIGQGLTGIAGRAAQHAEGKGYLGSVWTGLLATLIATPCTAPFMGPAIGYALTQPALAALAVFGALGLGMAAPYVLLAIFPHWLRFLPRPGPWMITLKEVMAFPMFATVVWLVWVFGRQVGSDAVVTLLLCLLFLALGAWLYGRFGSSATPTGRRWIFGRGLAAAAAVGGIVMALSIQAPADGGTAAHVASAPEGWVPYNGRVITARQAAGKPVFLDFTADWCLTCKANEAAFLDTQAVRDAFERHGVLAMQADWTRSDARITQALARLDRSSVPLYVIVPPDPDQPAVVLRTAITTQYVVDALDGVLSPATR